MLVSASGFLVVPLPLPLLRRPSPERVPLSSRLCLELALQTLKVVFELGLELVIQLVGLFAFCVAVADSVGDAEHRLSRTILLLVDRKRDSRLAVLSFVEHLGVRLGGRIRFVRMMISDNVTGLLQVMCESRRLDDCSLMFTIAKLPMRDCTVHYRFTWGGSLSRHG